MSTKFYSIRFEVPIHHDELPKVLAFLTYLKAGGIDSEVNTVTVSTPPKPKSYFIDSEWGRMSPTRDQVLRALRERIVRSRTLGFDGVDTSGSQ